MDNVKITPGRLSLREMNLKHGGNNVRWLNDREERLLQTSLNSLEKARKRSLTRIQQEVKGLHHTLREHVTIRSVNPQLTKKTYFVPDKDDETKKSSSLHTVSFNLPDESLENESDEETRRLTVEDSKLEHISLGEVSNQTETSEFGPGNPSNQTQGAWTKKLSQGHQTSLNRQHMRKISNSEPPPTSAGSSSVSRRKISISDLPREGTSPLVRKKPVFAGEFHSAANTAIIRNTSGSTEMLDLASTQTEPFSPSVRRKTSNPLRSPSNGSPPLFITRRLSHHQPSSLTSSPRLIRKISCPPQLSRQNTHQEELIPLHINTHGNPSRNVTMPTDLPKLSSSQGALQVHSPADSDCEDVCASGLGLHDCTLQEKVNNFLRSLQRDDDERENGEESNQAHTS